MKKVFKNGAKVQKCSDLDLGKHFAPGWILPVSLTGGSHWTHMSVSEQRGKRWFLFCILGESNPGPASATQGTELVVLCCGSCQGRGSDGLSSRLAWLTDTLRSEERRVGKECLL